MLLHVTEAVDELAVRRLQRVLRIDREVPREVRQDEEEIAQLVRGGGAFLRGNRGAQLGKFLLDLGEQALQIRPVEADPRRLGGDPQRLQQRRQRGGDAREQRPVALAAPLLHLDLLPLRQNLVGGIQAPLAENVRVPADNLVRDAACDLLKVEFTAFVGDL